MSTSAALARSLVHPATEITETSRPASPFVKWVGGKGRVLPSLIPLLPEGVERMRHVEPFVGGGAFFFHRQPRRALLSDINPSLVNTYQVVQQNVDALIDCLRVHADLHCSEHYYAMRTRYNHEPALTPVERASLFIYLNKTCFNGLHRVNKKGEFNVPVGRYVNPRICNEPGLRASSRALRNTKIACAGFDALLRRARPGDFLYFDPPYAPVTATANFTSYSQDGFSHEDQVRLRDVFATLDRRGCKLMLSNSDVPVIRDLYRHWNIDTVQVGRAINCKAKSRGKVSEVVVRNYR